MDSLRKRVLEYDRLRNTNYQMQVTTRATEARLICFDCRQTPDRQSYRQKWLEAHPMPRRICRKECGARNSWNDQPSHKRWHEDLYVSAHMPTFEALKLARKCQFCSGQLVEVVW